ncbi:MAG: NAD(P)-dependent glycerol-3-phosphate dehydrogenase [Clostridia bacterium]|jgi:glycerol-3-phosphate dehydrogenase (NAD(P)+)|nr:NAD(P)-dependent glycerol-3-phosphate dehydrogenase [Clostridia bacterium]
MAKITVLGSGGWGMALAISAYNNRNDVTLWSPFQEEVDLLLEKRTNEKLLRGVVLPEGIKITTDMSVVEGDTLTIIATPSIAVRSVAKQLSSYKNVGIVVNVSKGFEKGSLKFLTEVISEELPKAKVVALSGPSHAEEVARNIPTSIVATSNSVVAAQTVQDIMSGGCLRVYTSTDLVGVELGGAIKNVIAIAAGCCDGLGLGDNTKAALITRGLSEMARLGVCMGANEYTFAGLTGIGDLVVTCTSRHSRNNRFGYKVGSGTPVKTALEEVGTVEGYYATEMVYQLAKKYSVELPIINECYALLYEDKPVNEVVKTLMNRPQKSER